MNYLAHAYLSPSDPQLILGNLAGDSVRHIDTGILPLEIQQGLELHEIIDTATDETPAFKTLRTMIYNAGLPYAGVLADLMIDHALAADWENRSSEPFQEFKARVYGLLEAGSGLISTRFFFTASVLVEEDWFESYRSLEGMQSAFYRLGRKTRRPLPLQEISLFLTEKRIKIIDYAGKILELVKDKLSEVNR